jgi:acetoin utilization deacetylase AcuC-like enzyme
MSFTTSRRTGWVNEELYNWHRSGDLNYEEKLIEPGENWENEGTKRRFANLLARTKLLKKLTRVEARDATKEEICSFHTEAYHDRIMQESANPRGGDGGELAVFQFGGYEIATLSAGGVLAAVEAVMKKEVDNAYCLVRPPGHHARADLGMGFCIFNNVAIAALHLKKKLGIKRIAIVDYDVHHGNGTEDAFRDDPDVLFISLHQDNNYPQGSGSATERGSETGRDPKTGMYTTINIPLPPGSGKGAYGHAFETVVLPSVRKFEPEFILVSSGFDGSYSDCLAAMMLSSADYHYFAQALCGIADELCEGRIVFAHEGGYSKDYVPFCGAAVVESLLGVPEEARIEDPYLGEVSNWGYQQLMPHQMRVVDEVRILHGLLAEPKQAVREQLARLVADLKRMPGVDLQDIRECAATMFE